MRTIIKIRRKIHKWIYGASYRSIPSIIRLQYKATRDIQTWKIKHVVQERVYDLFKSGWFLVNSHYPDPKILLKNEIGANVLSKTRYILKGDR